MSHRLGNCRSHNRRRGRVSAFDIFEPVGGDRPLVLKLRHTRQETRGHGEGEMASSSEDATLAAADAAGRAPADAGPTPPASDYPPLGQAYWALLFLRCRFSSIRSIAASSTFLIEPIKRDLHLTDVQVSLLMGFAFVVFYILLGFPIASLADSKSRRLIVSFGLFCWSGMTALCGVAQNFWSFFLSGSASASARPARGRRRSPCSPTSSRRQSLRAQSHS